MARKLRIEYAGAMYHVISRGNYRADVFASPGARQAFVHCLGEACAKAHWRLHAFVVMRNHYHLALETPEPNLVEGMRWLQSTYANRFNRLRDERGHVFQGRYHALLVEDASRMGVVCHYIHLNPVRAGICDVSGLENFAFSSYFQLWRPTARLPYLETGTALAAAGGLEDDRTGWQRYAAFLKAVMGDKSGQESMGFRRINRGWVFGGRDFRENILHQHQARLAQLEFEGEVGEEIKPLQWQAALAEQLRRIGKSRVDVAGDRKAAAWKVAAASHMRTTTTATNVWLATALNMGAPSALSRYITEFRRGLRPDVEGWYAGMSKGMV